MQIKKVGRAAGISALFGPTASLGLFPGKTPSAQTSDMQRLIISIC